MSAVIPIKSTGLHSALKHYRHACTLYLYTYSRAILHITILTEIISIILCSYYLHLPQQHITTESWGTGQSCSGTWHVIHAYIYILTYLHGGINIKRTNYLGTKSLQILVLVLKNVQSISKKFKFPCIWIQFRSLVIFFIAYCIHPSILLLKYYEWPVFYGLPYGLCLAFIQLFWYENQLRNGH